MHNMSVNFGMDYEVQSFPQVLQQDSSILAQENDIGIRNARSPFIDLPRTCFFLAPKKVIIATTISFGVGLLIDVMLND